MHSWTDSLKKGAMALAFPVLVALLPVSVFPETSGPEKNAITVDFNDVIPSKGHGVRYGKKPPLTIAVAAMISPKSTYSAYVDLLNLIGEITGRHVVFVQKKTYAAVNTLLHEQKLDLAFVCSGPYVQGHDEFGMEILAVPVCHGERVYYSYFIASQAGGIGRFDDLRGKTFAFTDPLSNTGCMVPTYVLAVQGETPEHYFKKTFFTHSHDNSIKAVAHGLADGAAVDSLIFEFIQSQNPELTSKVKVIKKSPPYGIPPVVVHPFLDHNLKENLRNIFLSIHEDPKGKELLDVLKIERFEKGHDDDYASVRELNRYLSSNRNTGADP